MTNLQGLQILHCTSVCSIGSMPVCHFAKTTTKVNPRNIARMIAALSLDNTAQFCWPLRETQLLLKRVELAIGPAAASALSITRSLTEEHAAAAAAAAAEIAAARQHDSQAGEPGDADAGVRAAVSVATPCVISNCIISRCISVMAAEWSFAKHVYRHMSGQNISQTYVFFFCVIVHPVSTFSLQL